jgi:hypothetical protein
METIMTRGEFRTFVHNKSSLQNWTIDPIQFHNNGTILLILGDEFGKYIMIEKTGKFSLGYYLGAYDNIGSALFSPEFSKQFASLDTVVEYVSTVEPTVNNLLNDFTLTVGRSTK